MKVESGIELTIIQIDAYFDWRDERRGEPKGFSNTMRRASALDHVENIIQVGIRRLGSARREEVEIATICRCSTCKNIRIEN